MKYTKSWIKLFPSKMDEILALETQASLYSIFIIVL